MAAVRKLFERLPRLLALAAGAMLAGLVLLVMFGEDAFSFAYENRSPISNLIAGAAGLGAGAMLIRLSTGARRRAERPVWQLGILFALVLAVQFAVAHSCWFHLGWDPGACYTTALEIATGQPRSLPDYFDLCPNNAPFTALILVPVLAAVKLGLAVPYVVLPYINAVLLNLSAFCCVLCVRRLTRSPVARAYALIVSIGWIALSPYLLYPYTDTFSILFPVLALYCWLSVRKPALRWFLVSLLCFLGASIKPTALIALIALAGLEICRFLSRKPQPGWWTRCAAVAAALVLGMMPGQVFQRAATEWLAGSATPQGQLSVTHYLMLGMNGQTYGGHSMEDVAFSQSFDTLEERQKANLQRAWERVSERTLKENIHFFTVKAYKAYADGSFASIGSFLPVDVPERTDALSVFLRSLYHRDGALMPACQALAQMVWLGMLGLCAAACFRHKRRAVVPVLGLTMIGLTAYLLLFEVWPRYLFLYAPYFVVLASLALDPRGDGLRE